MATHQITTEDCLRMSKSIAGSLKELSIDIHPSSDLARIIKELRWLGSFSPTAHQPATAHASDPQRALAAFPLIEQGGRVARALRRCRDAPGAGEVAGRLGSQLDRLTTQEAAAQDFLFELEIAGRLVERGAVVRFEEPDLLWEVPGSDSFVAIACKRPRSVSGIKRQLRRAGRQLRDSGHPGFIVVGLGPFLHRSSDPAKKTIQYLVREPNELSTLLQPRVDGLVRELGPELERVWRYPIWGVLFCGVATGVSSEPTAFIYRWIRHPVSAPGSEGFAETLDHLLFVPAV